MYLQQFDTIVKEKCKQHKPMKIHNTSSLFSREAAIKFRNDSAKYEPQASGNLVGSQPGASYVGYQSGFRSATIPLPQKAQENLQEVIAQLTSDLRTAETARYNLEVKMYIEKIKDVLSDDNNNPALIPLSNDATVQQVAKIAEALFFSNTAEIKVMYDALHSRMPHLPPYSDEKDYTATPGRPGQQPTKFTLQGGFKTSIIQAIVDSGEYDIVELDENGRAVKIDYEKAFTTLFTIRGQAPLTREETEKLNLASYLSTLEVQLYDEHISEEQKEDIREKIRELRPNLPMEGDIDRNQGDDSTIPTPHSMRDRARELAAGAGRVAASFLSPPARVQPSASHNTPVRVQVSPMNEQHTRYTTYDASDYVGGLQGNLGESYSARPQGLPTPLSASSATSSSSASSVDLIDY